MPKEKTSPILVGAGIILIALILSIIIAPGFMNQYGNIIGGIIIFLPLFLLVWIGLFLLFRVFVLWYWKIDKMVKLLEKIEENTRK